MSVDKRDNISRLETIGVFYFEWHGQNEVGNIAILVLWRDREKLYSLNLCSSEASNPNAVEFSYVKFKNGSSSRLEIFIVFMVLVSLFTLRQIG